MLKADAGNLQTAVIIQNRPIAPDVYHMILKAPKLAEKARPGQFVMVKVASGLEPILRRPFSLYRFNKTAGKIELVYQIVGKGTDILAKRKPGEDLELLGPLGNGFCVKEEKRIGLVGGGMGIVPLLSAAERIVREGKEVVSFLGAKTGDYLLAIEEFEGLGRLFLTTDDGSVGERSFVTDILKGYLRDNQLDLVLACGPMPMLQVLANIVNSHGIPTELSLEQRMGCGIGVCLGCAFPIKADNVEGYTYKRVCCDGPVFWAHDVLFSLP